MPRFRRMHGEGTVQHVISRFVNHEFLFDLPGAREEYLRRAAKALTRTDWIAFAYCLMSSHVHWAFLAGRQASGVFVRALHGGFARWLNREYGRLGPVFADRHRSLTFIGESAAGLVAYIHNNPVRAGVVTDPADSTWTSHRAYVGQTAAPPWLRIDIGLQLCGVSPAPADREAFHEVVRRGATDHRCGAFTGDDMQARLRDARRATRAPVDLATPVVRSHDGEVVVRSEILVPAACPDRKPFVGTPADVLRVVAEWTGLTPRVLGSLSRRRPICAARRLALLVWTIELNRPSIEMTRALGLVPSSGSDLISTASTEARAEAVELARILRGAW